jgi:hypothetical protein
MVESVMSETNTNYEIGRFPPVNQTNFLLLRAAAIQAYANVEMSLSILFSFLVGTTIDIGGLACTRFG